MIVEHTCQWCSRKGVLSEEKFDRKKEKKKKKKKIDQKNARLVWTDHDGTLDVEYKNYMNTVRIANDPPSPSPSNQINQSETYREGE